LTGGTFQGRERKRGEREIPMKREKGKGGTTKSGLRKTKIHLDSLPFGKTIHKLMGKEKM